MRIFVGIEFDQAVKDYLYDLQNQIKPVTNKGNFTNYENFHLTLTFIGDLEEYELDSLYEIIDDISGKFCNFTINIGQFGSFHTRDKHLVYVKVLSGVEELTKLHKSLQEQLYSEAFIHKKEKFTPHITIAREVFFKDASILNIIQPYPDEIPVNKIVVFHSRRDKNNKLIYDNIYEQVFRNI